MCERVSGDFDVHVMLQRHFYPAGFAVYITLNGYKRTAIALLGVEHF